jgi:Cof subfamily protein (haloacid dehalogenase superfamily)
MQTGLFFDIDGTITSETHSLDIEVKTFLEHLFQTYTLIFVTCRSFNWGHSILKALNVPYYFACYNGSLILKMTERKVILNQYLDKSSINLMEEAVHGLPMDFVIYSGYENQDLCYYRKDRFPKKDLDNLLKRAQIIGEEWINIKDFDELPVSKFAAIKCFGQTELISQVSKKGEAKGLHIPVIKDPILKGNYVALATKHDVHKGSVVSYLKNYLNLQYTIAAGDDVNDLPMLKEADISIVMTGAPQELIDIADFIAPPCEERGIISGINKALL